MPATLTRPTQRVRGFTLLEILVVMAIIGAVSALAVVRLESSDARRVAQVAEQLATVLEAARDEAISTGNSVAISSDGQGYQFWSDHGDYGEWIALPMNELLPAKRLPDGVFWQAQRVNDRNGSLGERIIFPPDGVLDPFSVELRAGDTVVQLEGDVMGRIEVRNAS